MKRSMSDFRIPVGATRITVIVKLSETVTFPRDSFENGKNPEVNVRIQIYDSFVGARFYPPTYHSFSFIFIRGRYL